MIDYLPEDTRLEARFNTFLYEPVAEQDNGTPISVLSALTRANHDPWAEAARLASLSPDRAQRALVKILDQSIGRKLSLADMEAAAKRLLPLLPPRSAIASRVSTYTVRAEAARVLFYWLIWLGLIAMLIGAQAHNHGSVGRSEPSVANNPLADVSRATESYAQSSLSGWFITDSKRAAKQARGFSEKLDKP